MDENEIRETLQNEKKRLEELRDGLREGDELDVDLRGNSGGEISSADNHPADLGSETVQREVTLSTIEQIEAELDDVELAMKRLDEGTYGISEVSGKPIDEERLKALPATRFTLEEQQAMEQEVGARKLYNARGGSEDATTAI